ncbi:MAG TPA: PD-(D/E)XK nuclease family protein [Solirubrobacteraceae bacterium]|nr:PD-(D/E)XK nuclease family protein [Solirubrobacteraceae bacterium]
MPAPLDKDLKDLRSSPRAGAENPPARGVTARPEGAGGGRDADVERAEVRDVLAWTRLLADPGDASAVVRALARPPIELRQVDLARVIQIARRRKLDMVAALGAAIESPQVPPEARARIQRFLELHRAAVAALDAARPDLLARAALGAEREADRRSSSGGTQSARDGADAALRDMQRIVREEVLADVARIGARLSELRLDTDLDISHGVARYLELLKLSALERRPPEQGVGEALEDLNARLLAAATALQREILQSSPLDGTLLAADAAGGAEAGGGGGEADAGGYDERAARAQAVSPRGEPSLVPFLPRKGGGLALSASDIETYRSCPLRYKFARVLRIPTEPTLGQRFGIVVHQVLERYHSAQGQTLGQLLDLLDACWRRGGFGDDPAQRELRVKARVALERYHARLHGEDSEPVWFERQFSLRIGPHHLRGRVDRVDRLPGARGPGPSGGAGGEAPAGGRAGTGGTAEGEREAYELIDYKTSRPKRAEELQDDVQLSLYALAARESWQLTAASRAYYYVLDDLKVTLPGETNSERVRDVVMEVGEGILGQRFEPTPSKAACSICDFRIVCPAAER